MSETTNPTVGVVGVDHVSQALRELGFKVITAPAFRDAATAISNELKQAAFPVVVAESDVIGFGPWVTSVAAKTTVLLLRTRGDLNLTVPQAMSVPLPVTVNDLMPKLGYQAALHASGDVRVEAETAASVPAPEPVVAPVPVAAPDYVFHGDTEAPAIFRAEGGEGQPAEVSPGLFEPTGPTRVATADEGVYDASLFESAGVPAPVPSPATQPGPPVQASPAPAVEAPATPPLPPTQASATPLAAPAPVPVPAPQPTFETLVQGETPGAPAQTAPVAPPLPSPPQVPAAYIETPAAEQPVYSPAPVSTLERPAPPVYVEPTPVGEDMFDTRAARTPPNHVHRTVGGRKGQLLISFAGKGGVGKTSNALNLAKVASQAGLRAVLVDGNRGQADIRSYLRIPKDALPTIYDAVYSGDPASALLLPEQYNQYRPPVVEPLDFAIVQGPPRHLADPELVPAEAYAQVIDYARANSDLVVLDTQILEAHKTDMFDRLIIPAMLSGAWSVAIVNETRAGADNLLDSFQELAARGVTSAHSLIIAALYEQFDDMDRAAIERKYGQYGTFVGSTGVDPAFKDQLNLGNVHSDSPAVSAVTRAILHRVTGNPTFAPLPEEPTKRRWGKKSKRGRK